MPALGLVLFAIYGLLAFGLRMVVQRRRTGSAGFAGLRGNSGSLEWLSGLLVATAFVLSVLGALLQLAGALSPIDWLAGTLSTVLGIVLATLGIAVTVIAQFAMGASWRIGVDPSESTELVTGGLFSVVRNPIFAAMVPSFAGIALLAPNIVTVAGTTILLIALELQTRLIEEPYLQEVHGERYTAYANRVGRFLPLVGRLRLGDKPPAASLRSRDVG